MPEELVMFKTGFIDDVLQDVQLDDKPKQVRQGLEQIAHYRLPAS